MFASDLVRFLAITISSISYPLAIANLVISFKVLKPRPFNIRNFVGSGGGFIWLHIVCVAIPFQGFVTWGIIEIEQRLGTQPTWRPWALMILCFLINIGYVIIFRVEQARLRLQKIVSEQ